MINKNRTVTSQKKIENVEGRESQILRFQTMSGNARVDATLTEFESRNEIHTQTIWGKVSHNSYSNICKRTFFQRVRCAEE